jgi:hypothetical protein
MPDATPEDTTPRAPGGLLEMGHPNELRGAPGGLLEMGHLNELRAEIEATQRAVQEAPFTAGPPPAAPGQDPREKKLYSFDIEYKGARGQITKGRFTNKILSIGEKISVGTMRARLQMGVSLDAMDVDTYNMLFRVTWLQQSLTEKPKWAEDLLALESEGLIKDIFDKVDAHERYFRGEAPGAAAGQRAI